MAELDQHLDGLADIGGELFGGDAGDLDVRCNYTYIQGMDNSLLPAIEFSEQCACLNVQRAARALARRYDAALRPVGLTSGQFTILAGLNQPDPVPLGFLASILGLERTTLTRNLLPLEKAGWIASDEGEGDRRQRKLRLTPAGRSKLAAGMPLWHEAQEDSRERIAKLDWSEFRAGLSALASGYRD